MSDVFPASSITDLDLRGLKCPLPVLRTRQALRRIKVGAVLHVHCSDPLAAIDIPHLLRQDGHRLIGESIANGIATFTIVKRGA